MRRFGHNFGATKSKYGSKKVTYKGIVFDSKHEMEYYLKLLDLQEKGKIIGLRRQTRFMLIPSVTELVPKQLKTKVRYEKRTVEMAAMYHNDFTYKENGVYYCVEYKSKMTTKLPDYILRRKLMVQKIHEHNKKGRGQWVFREVIYGGKNLEIIDKK